MRMLRRLSAFSAVVTALALLTPTALASAASGGVTLSGATNNSTVSGLVTLTALGTAASGDTADTLEFFVDARSVDFELCSEAVSCSKSYTWDATGLTGTHTLQAKFRTENSATFVSAAVSVTVTSPGPTATVTSPTAGSQVVRGAVPVGAVGAVDPSQNDTGAFANLLVDGADAAFASCPAPLSHACAVTFTWDTTQLAGAHTLQVQFETSNGISVTSAAIAVTVHVPTRSKLAPSGALPYGHTAHLSGEVLSSTGSPLAGVPVQVVLRPASGKTSTKALLTDAGGQWSLAYKAKVNTAVLATVAESASWGASHASMTVHVYATGKCTTKSLVDAGAADSLNCAKTVPALKKGTKVQVQLLVHKKWHTLVTAKVSGVKFSVPFRLTARGTAQVRLYLPATKTLISSETTTFFIAVV